MFKNIGKNTGKNNKSNHSKKVGVIILIISLVITAGMFYFLYRFLTGGGNNKKANINNHHQQQVEVENTNVFPQYKYFPPDKLLYVYGAKMSTTHYYRYTTPTATTPFKKEGILLKDVTSGQQVGVMIPTGTSYLVASSVLHFADTSPSSKATARWIDGAMWQRIRDLTDGWIYTSPDHKEIQILHREHMLFLLIHSHSLPQYEWYVCYYDLFPTFPVQFTYPKQGEDSDVEKAVTSREDIPCTPLTFTELKLVDNYHYAKIDDWKNIILPQAELKLLSLQKNLKAYWQKRKLNPIDLGWHAPVNPNEVNKND